MRACEKKHIHRFFIERGAAVENKIAKLDANGRIDHSQMRGRSGSRTNLFGSKFLHRASGSTWIRRHIGFPRVRVFSHAKPRETVLKIGSLTWTAFSSRTTRGGAPLRTRARTTTRAGEPRSVSGRGSGAFQTRSFRLGAFHALPTRGGRRDLRRERPVRRITSAPPTP